MFILALVALPLLGGAPTERAARAKPTPDDSAQMTLVVVQNDRDVPVTVYLERGNEEVRLGRVGGMSDSTLRVPDFIAGQDVRFFVQPVGESEESTGLVDLERGEHLGLVIPPR